MPCQGLSGDTLTLTRQCGLFWEEQQRVLLSWLGAERDCCLFSEQTQESIQRFEQQAGLRDAGYTPHKGLTTEETKYLRVAEALHVSNQCCSWLEMWLWLRSLQFSCLATQSDKIMGKGTRTALLRCAPADTLSLERSLRTEWCSVTYAFTSS